MEPVSLAIPILLYKHRLHSETNGNTDSLHSAWTALKNWIKFWVAHLCSVLEVLLLFILSHAQLVNTNLFARMIADIMLLNKDFALPILVLEKILMAN